MKMQCPNMLLERLRAAICLRFLVNSCGFSGWNYRSVVISRIFLLEITEFVHLKRDATFAGDMVWDVSLLMCTSWYVIMHGMQHNCSYADSGVT